MFCGLSPERSRVYECSHSQHLVEENVRAQVSVWTELRQIIWHNATYTSGATMEKKISAKIIIAIIIIIM